MRGKIRRRRMSRLPRGGDGSSGTTVFQKPTMPLHHEKMSKRTARKGDIVTIELNLVPEHGYVPVPLFDTSGTVSLVLGWGNYLPGLHSLLEGMSVGDSFSDLSVDAGWGERNPELVVRVPKKKLKSFKDLSLLKVGSQIYLQGGIQVCVVEVTEDSIVVDGNPPLAGASFSASVKVLEIDSSPTAANDDDDSSQQHHTVATFALGCFWGGELAFMRVPGVVGTKVGYTQGQTVDPSYKEVCTGTTNHREAIMVIYNPSIVSYEQLVEVAMERLASTEVRMQHTKNANSNQYKHGIYFHTQAQREIAERIANQDDRFRIEVLPAATFYDAEDYHQQYLLKGGQSAKKGSKERIRCFG